MFFWWHDLLYDHVPTHFMGLLNARVFLSMGGVFNYASSVYKGTNMFINEKCRGISMKKSNLIPKDNVYVMRYGGIETWYQEKKNKRWRRCTCWSDKKHFFCHSTEHFKVLRMFSWLSQPKGMYIYNNRIKAKKNRESCTDWLSIKDGSNYNDISYFQT